MVFILDGNSEIDAHEWSRLSDLLKAFVQIENGHKSDFLVPWVGLIIFEVERLFYLKLDKTG